MRILAFLLLTLAATTAFALPSLEDVEHAVHRGDYPAAESMTREVIAARPDNAKAHYILAELLAHEGKLAEARTQAGMARQLDPQIRFTAPDRFRQFEAQLNGQRHSTPTVTAASVPRKEAETSGGGSGLLWIVLLLGAGAVFLLLRRRPAAPNYGAGYPAQPNGMPGAPGGYANAGYPGPMNAPGSGVGGTVAAGLGGLAAGMVAEHLIEGALDQRHHEQTNLGDGTLFGPPSSTQGESLEDRPIDFGNGNDWGGDAGGADTAGFDSGSGDDWS